MGRKAQQRPLLTYPLTLLLFLFFSFGKELRVCGSCEYRSIKEALRNARGGDTIIVEEGVYREGTLLIDKSVKFIGRNYPTLDGEGRYEVLKIVADGVLVEGFRVVNSGRSELEDIAGIKAEGVKNCVIRNNILENNFWGIYLLQSSECLIEGNVVKGAGGVGEVYTGNGIHLWNCEKVVIRKNEISGHRDGIYLEFVKDSLIAENYSYNNWRYGLHFMFSHRDTYVRNTFERNGAGVAVMYTKEVVMVANEFSNNWGDSSYGLLLKAINDSLVVNNVFYRNTVGIFMDECQRSTIRENDFLENGWAIRVWANSSDNLITRNNFLGNTFELSTNSSRNPNEITENYWSSYRGFDLNRDGVGDIPHKPVKLFSYIVENNPAAVVLLRSFFVELINYLEEALPAVISVEVEDPRPLMRKVQWKR
ncbi:MAG: nitrous oxide reductase family maturation protein NosD [Aquificae bacterium]|nr:nitrous oxide reductase family maturation protein NosD [Aquificota bacterium]